MKEFGADGFPDDLNNWSMENFKEAKRLFEKTVNRNEKALLGNESNSVELPNTSREKVIQKDDILNLQIMLGQIQTVDELIKNM